MEKLKQEFIDRVWKSWGSSLVGVLSAMGVEVINNVLLPYLDAQPQPWVHILALGLMAFCASLKSKALKQAPTLPPSILFALVLGAALLATPQVAHAQTSPVYGGCFDQAKSVCAGPGASLSLVGLDLDKGEFITGLITGVGYEITFFSQQWYRVGIGGYGNISSTSAGTSGMFSGLISFANYVRAGLAYQVIGAGPNNGFAAHPTLLLGIGSDFGRL